jgi:DNA repair protein RecO
MQQLQTRGIILSRTDFGEADRILTVLTPQQGKLRLMAKGVRKIKSKLAGGIELFSVSDITYIRGKGELGTLISARLHTHYGRIVRDLDRVQLGYAILKQLNRATEDQPESDYFHLAGRAFESLDSEQIDRRLVELWFQAQLLKSFAAHPEGGFAAEHIKTLRLLFSDHHPRQLQNIAGVSEIIPAISPILGTMLASYIPL